MSVLPIKTVAAEKWTGNVICICYHCGTKFGSANGVCSNNCRLCKTAELREAMDEDNRQVWAKDGKEFHCAYCEALVERKKLEKETPE